MARLINRIHVINHDDNIVNESDVAEGRVYTNPKPRNHIYRPGQANMQFLTM